MSAVRNNARGSVGRLAAALAVAAGTLTVASVALNAASVPAGAATCGVSLGTPQLEGALGSIVFQVPTMPTVPGQACNASITVTGTIATAGGTRPTNVVNNGTSYAITLSFLPGEPAPDILWEWSPHCADPATPPYDFFVSSSAGATVSAPVSPVEPCSDFGTITSATLQPPVVVVPNPSTYVAIGTTAANGGYWLAQRGGGISPFGNAANTGMPYGYPSVVGIAGAPAGGYWVAQSDGGVFAYGAPFDGSMGGMTLAAPIVGIAATPDGGGYWLVATDGGVFGFGDAHFYGSVPGVLQPGQSLNQPIVGIASSPDGGGYWLVARDGGIFSFGDAHYQGSMGGMPLNAPIVGMAGNTLGGYWLVGSDGGIFAFDAAFKGSLGSIALNAPITGMASSSDGLGYLMVAADGGAFAFGDAHYWGSAA